MKELHIPHHESWHLVMDFDGVFTNNLVYLNTLGEEFVECSREDGMGLEMLRVARELGYFNLTPFVVTRESGGPAKARCEKLSIRVFTGIRDKKRFLEEDIQKFEGFESFDLSRTIYLGNDINDIHAMQICRISIAPKDAHPIAQQSATYVSTSKTGGRGFIREVIDILLKNYISKLSKDLRIE
jgi:YrbI family 3-deoxy-D-manno-octulosonate 8-phosphate phosphatase